MHSCLPQMRRSRASFPLLKERKPRSPPASTRRHEQAGTLAWQCYQQPSSTTMPPLLSRAARICQKVLDAFPQLPKTRSPVRPHQDLASSGARLLRHAEVFNGDTEATNVIIEKVRRLAATSKLRLLPDYDHALPVLSRYCCARPLRSVQHFFGLIHSVDGGVS